MIAYQTMYFKRKQGYYVWSCRSKIHFLTFEIYRSENDFYCGHSYLARYDERIRFNGKTNDRCAADRSGEHQLGGVCKCKGEA